MLVYSWWTLILLTHDGLCGVDSNVSLPHRILQNSLFQRVAGYSEAVKIHQSRDSKRLPGNEMMHEFV